MNSPASGGLLRRLAGDIRVLTQVPAATGEEHPLGLGLAAGHQWNFGPTAPVGLPTADAALAQVRQIIHLDIYGLDATHRESAWRALLTVPTVGYLLATADLGPWLARGTDLPEDLDPAQLHHLVFAGAVAPGQPRLVDGALENEPIIGIVEVLAVASNSTTTHTWVNAQWLTSATDAIEALEPLHPQFAHARGLTLAQPAGKPVRRHRGQQHATPVAAPKSLTVLLPSFLVADTELVPRLRASALIAGFDAVVEGVGARGSRPTRQVTEQLRQSAPSVLVVADVVLADAADAITAFRVANAHGKVFPVACGPGCADVLPRFRALLATLAGVSLNCIPLGADRPVAPSDTQPLVTARNSPPYPIVSIARERRHDQWGRFVKDSATGFWYARDRGHHGELSDEFGPLGQFKRFTEGGTGLTCTGSVDSEGNQIDPKHESVIGQFVSWRDLHG